MKAKTCHKSCITGNPYRGYICACTKCNGSAHGTTQITVAMIVEMLDRRLIDPNLGKFEFQRFLEIQKLAVSLLPPRRLRKAA